ncbi:MAG: hypothetical protein CMF62_09475 [Magnetococcales bacterium]|nr:hypothetical protein [Magnetococcales bacterium]|tara:strand:+ start:394118 stop:394522 length:405 start_codon:yes stop_codon:yes gene_type:complete
MTPQQALQLMGLGRLANQADLKKAYRRLASKCHPDLNPHNPKATQQFQLLNEAHKLLKDKLPPAPKVQAKVKPKAKPQPKAEPKPEPQPQAKPQPKPQPKPEIIRATPQQVRAQCGYAQVRDYAPKGQTVNIYC